jgi:hypothetical protein
LELDMAVSAALLSLTAFLVSFFPNSGSYTGNGEELGSHPVNAASSSLPYQQSAIITT